ncbi:uncharacterized protein A4U43_C07F15980 [Asparagus officinalis]|uniref:C2HC NPR-type domain-containing protein n=1 Tax=Asparagus officinalis TaxID=4686 RepID=A0A5P1EFN1_ASPOF|nr:uncharacterized protein A4U43_C07F15980 [Asparagus officinalis]
MDEESSNNTSSNPLLKSLSMRLPSTSSSTRQAFSDANLSGVEGAFVHAHALHRSPPASLCLPANSFSRPKLPLCPRPKSHYSGSPRGGQPPRRHTPCNAIGYEVFMLNASVPLQRSGCRFLPQKHEPRAGCSERGCWHVHCTAAVDLALDVLAAARAFGVEQLAMIAQKQLASIVEKASIDDVMKVLIASRKQDLQQLLTPPVPASRRQLGLRLRNPAPKHPPPRNMSSRIDDSAHLPLHLHHRPLAPSTTDTTLNLTTRIAAPSDSLRCEAPSSSMVMGRGPQPRRRPSPSTYAVENCKPESSSALLEARAAGRQPPGGARGQTPPPRGSRECLPRHGRLLLLDPHCRHRMFRTVDGVTHVDVSGHLSSDFLFKGACRG